MNSRLEKTVLVDGLEYRFLFLTTSKMEALVRTTGFVVAENIVVVTGDSIDSAERLPPQSEELVREKRNTTNRAIGPLRSWRTWGDVEDDKEWIDLTVMMEDGSAFSLTAVTPADIRHDMLETSGDEAYYCPDSVIVESIRIDLIEAAVSKAVAVGIETVGIRQE